MRLYFLVDIEAPFAEKGIYKKGHVYDVALHNTPTMLDNGFAVKEEDKPETIIEKVVKPVAKKRGRPRKKK